MTKRPNRRIKKTIKKAVKDQLKTLGETKFELFGTGGVGIAALHSTTTMIPAYDIAQGVDVDQRVGNKITPTGMTIRFSAYRGNADSTLRLLVVRWKPEYVFINTGLILESGDSGNTNYINAPYETDKINRKRFEVLHDSCYVLDDGKQNHICKEINVKVNGRPVIYSGAAAGAIRANEIHFVWISDSALATAPSVFYTCHARYKDL